MAISRTSNRRAVLILEDRLRNVPRVAEQTDFADVDLLRAGLDKAAAGVDVVVGKRLFDLADAEAVGDQLVGIDRNLIFARNAPETRDIHHVGHGFQFLGDDPILQRFQFHEIVLRIGAGERVPVQLAHRAVVRAHRGLQTIRQV